MYPLTRITTLNKGQLIEENRKFHQTILMDLKDHYFKPLFSKYGKKWIDLLTHVRLPPNIPAQNKDFDCGVFFLLAFAKYLVFNKEFDFSNEDMRSLRTEIRTELIASKFSL